jgi:hypothetical protein
MDTNSTLAPPVRVAGPRHQSPPVAIARVRKSGTCNEESTPNRVAGGV